MSMYYVYILECGDGTFYTGITNDLEGRILAHNGKRGQGAKYTRSRRPVSLFYSEMQPTKGDALRREHQIKRMERREKQALSGMKTS